MHVMTFDQMHPLLTDGTSFVHLFICLVNITYQAYSRDCVSTGRWEEKVFQMEETA
jgi:hypothetical protein